MTGAAGGGPTVTVPVWPQRRAGGSAGVAQSLCRCVTVTVPAAVRCARTLVDSGRDVRGPGGRGWVGLGVLFPPAGHVVSFMCVPLSVSGLLVSS